MLRAGSPRLFVDKPSGTHLTYHPGRTGGGAAASLGSEGRIITLPSFSVATSPDRRVNAQPGERRHALPLWLHGIPQHRRRRRRRRDAPAEAEECCARNQEHMSAGEKALRGEGGHGETNAHTYGGRCRTCRFSGFGPAASSAGTSVQTSTRAENRSRADLLGI